MLHEYAATFGQIINLSKSSLSFSPNTPTHTRKKIARILHAHNLSAPDKFLEFPLDIPKSKQQIFSFIRDRISSITVGWEDQLLSKGGKETLINVVAMDIPNYAMPYFKMHLSLCNSINSMVANLWWGQQKNERKMHWISWPKLYDPKCKGGMGFGIWKISIEPCLQNKDGEF